PLDDKDSSPAAFVSEDFELTFSTRSLLSAGETTVEASSSVESASATGSSVCGLPASLASSESGAGCRRLRRSESEFAAAPATAAPAPRPPAPAAAAAPEGESSPLSATCCSGAEGCSGAED